MPTLTYTVGLPGSGKSYWAAEQAANGATVIVNKDDIRRRFEATGWKWSHEAEKEVEWERDDLIKDALRAGLDVISSDTNFARKHKVRFEQLARQFGAELVKKDFTRVPIDVCIERDSRREGKARVGEKVIRDMAAKYLSQVPAIAPFKNDSTLPSSAVICDLDGTLALFDHHRGPYDASKCADDRPNMPILRLLKMLDAQRVKIIYLSGREDLYREPTKQFLTKFGAPEGPLFMRPAGDFRKDWIVKQELFRNNVEGRHFIEFVLDDRDQVVDMWRKGGLTCLQVAPGAF